MIKSLAMGLDFQRLKVSSRWCVVGCYVANIQAAAALGKLCFLWYGSVVFAEVRFPLLLAVHELFRGENHTTTAVRCARYDLREAQPLRGEA